MAADIRPHARDTIFHRAINPLSRKPNKQFRRTMQAHIQLADTPANVVLGIEPVIEAMNSTFK